MQWEILALRKSKYMPKVNCFNGHAFVLNFTDYKSATAGRISNKRCS